MTKDICSSYDIDGLMWSSERQGPFNNAIQPFKGERPTNRITCFCPHHRKAAKARGIDLTPLLTPAPKMLRLGPDELRAALLLPSWHDAASGPLPVLLDPYGGPGAQRVFSTQAVFLTSQWFAEQGFAVLVRLAGQDQFAVRGGGGSHDRSPGWM